MWAISGRGSTSTVNQIGWLPPDWRPWRRRRGGWSCCGCCGWSWSGSRRRRGAVLAAALVLLVLLPYFYYCPAQLALQKLLVRREGGGGAGWLRLEGGRWEARYTDFYEALAPAPHVGEGPDAVVLLRPRGLAGGEAAWGRQPRCAASSAQRQYTNGSRAAAAVKLLLVIKSHPSNFARRQRLRQSWLLPYVLRQRSGWRGSGGASSSTGSGGQQAQSAQAPSQLPAPPAWSPRSSRVQYVFVQGQAADRRARAAASREWRRFGDLLVVRAQDGYLNLTYKYVAILHWLTEQLLPAAATAAAVSADCPTGTSSAPVPDYVAVMDDDAILRPERLLAYLERYLADSSPSDTDSTILCQTHEDRVILHRNNWCYDCRKWCVENHEFEGRLFYPAFCHGFLTLLPAPLVPRLYAAASSRVPYYRLDDVYMTGLVRQAVGARLRDIGRRHLRVLPRRVRAQFARCVQWASAQQSRGRAGHYPWIGHECRQIFGWHVPGPDPEYWDKYRLLASL